MKKFFPGWSISFLMGSIGIMGILLSSPALARAGSFLEQDPLSLLAPHTDYKIEWWYVTGFLKTNTGERLGFQGTFFRFATGFKRPADLPASPWEPKEIVSFHGAISFLDKKKFVSKEVTRRAFRSLAGTHSKPFSVNVGTNSLTGTQGMNSKDPVFSLTERVGGHRLTLSLTPKTSLLWQDPTGKLKTGPGTNDWAWYYSYPEMAVAGTLKNMNNPGKTVEIPVKGQAWFDHEWTDQALGADQRGWIWMWGLFDSPQGKKGFMMFQMIRKDGSMDSYRGGTVFTKTSQELVQVYARSRDLRIIALDYKKRKSSCFPKRVAFDIENLGTVEAVPDLNDQELKGIPDYWEGAMRLERKDKGFIYPGMGYLEVTGAVNLPDLCK